MATSTYLQKYVSLYNTLCDIIIKSEQKVIGAEVDDLFQQNINFFVKSYLISICTYLEAYLQDLALDLALTINSRIDEAKIPHNFMHWGLDTGIKDKDLKFSYLRITIDKKTISDELSANPYKTIKLFKNFGIDLTSSAEFESNKSVVNTIVTKRNNIIHHNDSASDVSFNDLLQNVTVFKEYMSAIDQVVVDSKP